MAEKSSESLSAYSVKPSLSVFFWDFHNGFSLSKALSIKKLFVVGFGRTGLSAYAVLPSVDRVDKRAGIWWRPKRTSAR